MYHVVGDIKIIDDNKIETDACSYRNRLVMPTELLKMDLVSTKMSRNKTWKPEITTY